MFTIYALIDPRDNLIRYVGITDDVYRRFGEHARGEGKNPGKDAWMRGLQAEQEVIVMKSLEKTDSYHDALRLEEKWIHRLLAEGFPLFNVSRVEAPAPRPVREKLIVFDGSKRRHNARDIDDILDWYLLSGELPPYVSDRQRYDYRHHPRLEDRKKLLILDGELHK